ncbi:MAG: NifB/NifX family molybdenum-iron cluster-binding protein [Clostridiales bacterium]|nr:NifB/NifX family molybdenum-iron cluster-binding protein [Clostridiales bacterium]
MKVAIAKEGNEVAEHFGHCSGFEIFRLENKLVGDFDYVENPGHRPGYLPNFLAEMGVSVIISGGMGSSAQELFKRSGISVVVGAKGDILDVINEYARGELTSTEELCEKHEHADDNDGFNHHHK